MMATSSSTRHWMLELEVGSFPEEWKIWSVRLGWEPVVELVEEELGPEDETACALFSQGKNQELETG